ncbi:TolB family protein [Desulfolutivibrio sulfoxidireducens]|uniref:TolB family protein n=1 Tax=Desulfolutivibrio sulfoxidireducens TaxID=2773299 RepID=UPI00159DCA7E|nr:PD40 domain-containing protein [Desulfolutivibrio sulfoxidireducens]QLA17007.1 hypothetical protein GD605_13360 [Desulfolutivibrio sulfoxidireducens]
MIRLVAIFVCLSLCAAGNAPAGGLPDAPGGIGPADVFVLAGREGTEASLEARDMVRLIAAGYDAGEVLESLRIMHPLDGAVFPADLAPPLVSWVDGHPRADMWLVSIRLADSRAVYALCRERSFVPSEEIWRMVRAATRERQAVITVHGVDSGTFQVVSQDCVSVSTSRDRVGALIMYRQLPPVFSFAEKRLDLVGGRLGDPASPDPPKVLFQGVPACVGCHSFSRDGRVLGMDFDNAGDKGGYVLSGVRRDMGLGKDDLISWNGFPRIDDRQTTGLYARVSPDGRRVVATVNEIMLLIKTDDPFASQLFYPLRGILAVYDRKDATFTPLAGADDPGLTQTCPEFSPDGLRVVFARTGANMERVRELGGKTVFALPDASLDELNAAYPVRFDICRAPLGKGRNVRAEPLPGASDNGMSNYNPRFSPDGKWIVFTKSRLGLVLQPDSRLCIVPAAGGVPREMACNLGNMNSWHGFSPNGRWLLFVSKETGADSRVWITHVDGRGRDTPPVLLHRLGEPGLAVNVPEFVPRAAGVMERITFPGQ